MVVRNIYLLLPGVVTSEYVRNTCVNPASTKDAAVTSTLSCYRGTVVHMYTEYGAEYPSGTTRSLEKERRELPASTTGICLEPPHSPAMDRTQLIHPEILQSSYASTSIANIATL
mgnify:CR=1 FL=1